MAAIGRHEPTQISVGDFLGAGAIMASTPVIIIGCATIYPVLAYLDRRFDGVVSSSDALTLTIASVAYGAIGSLGGVALSLIEGFGRLPLRNTITIAANIAVVAVSWPLVKHFGVIGFCVANIAPMLIQFVLAIACLIVFHSPHKPPSVAGVVGIVRQIWRASFGLSLISVLQMAFEPTTKLLLSIDGSLASLASFELALRVSTSVRGLFLAGIRPLFVAGSRTTARMPDDIGSLYDASNVMVYKLAILLAAGQFASAPILSLLAFSSLDVNFIDFFSCLVVASTINALGFVGYYFQLSSGAMRPLTVIQVISVVINLSLGYLGGRVIGAMGIVLAYCITYVFSGVASLKLWLDHQGVSIPAFIFSHGDLESLAAALIALLLLLQFEFLRGIGGNYTLLVVSIVACVAITALSLRQLKKMWGGKTLPTNSI
jgi:O-antigen/teichoic acid export membrane protein